MGTRSAIIMKTDTGYAGIYCHWDGYPSYVGELLLTHYNTPEMVTKLIALGDLSSLSKRLNPIGPHSFANPEGGTTIAYGRDRGETGTEAKTGKTVKEITDKIDHHYAYVFDGKKWLLNGKPLTLKRCAKGID